nr:laminin subunit alpha-like [Onthophagus taurus]
MNDYTEQQLFSLEDRLPKVFDHAANLSTRAEELNNILHETEGTSANAIRAANAYNDIVTAIEEAFAAAEESKEYVTNASTAREALNKKVANATDNASDLLDDVYATKQNIQKELEPKLLESQIKSRKIRSIHDKNVEKVKGIEDFIKNYPSQSVDGLLIDALDTTNTADVETQDILKQIGSNYNEVPHETNAAKELPKKLHNANQGIDQVKQQLNDINEKLPELIEKLKKYPTQPSDLGAISDNLQDKIKKLNRQIALARDIANRIKVGLRFERNTTLELRNIESLPDLATSTYISGYFKTKEKNGLLLYLGNEVGTNLRRTTTDDFMALEIENGYPVLTIDLGVRAERIVNPKYVAEDIWYQFIIERTGLNAKLIIRKDRRDGTVEETVQEYVLDGPYTIFNVDRNQTKLFVGSHPPEFRIQDSIRQSSFEGEVEDLVIGDTPVSLWNFNSGFENHRGAYERDRLKNLHPSTGCRFNGEGYVLVDARTTQSINKRSDIQLRFKTFATTGLLFLYGKERTFIALEIRNGKVLYKYNLGYGIKVWSSPNTYNDGNWHLISARRDGSKSVLTIDDEPIEDVTPSVGGTTLEQADYLFFGGYPGTHHFIDVTNTDFDGCIDNVIMRNPIDLNQNVRAYGVTPGCPVKFARLVSFSKTKPRAYMEAGPVYVNNDFKMTLKFKTKEKDGLIFYATNREQSDSVSLALKNSKLILISQNIELSFNDNYNDSEWHVVSIRHNSTALRIDLDDYDFREINPDAPPKPLHITYGQLFIGGVPDEYIIKKRNAATDKSFVGCIGDATLNGTIVNFANSTNKLGDKLGKCILDERDDISSIDHTVPPLPPLHELPKVSTALPEIQTLDPYNEDLAKSGRGDGGQDAGRDSGEVEPITDAPDHDVVPPDDDFESTEATPVTSRIPYPPRTVPQPGIYEPTCALPLHPVMTEINEVYGPFKFGSAPESRIEYEQPRGKYKKQYEFMVEFKTQATNGLIFYASNPDNSHYVALYMQDGHLIHKFDGGTGPAFMKTDLTYNDDQWHKVVFTRNNSVGSLKVDGDSFSSNTSQPTIRVDIGAPFMLGGFSPEKRSFITDTTNIEDNFQGCLKNFGMNSKPMEKPVSHAIESCTDGTEEGTFFQGGYISLKNKFKVGLEMEIKMDIKPRNVTGLLVAVHGRKDFLVLEMVNGVLRFTVENGRGPITTSFEPDSRHYLCDGKWHSIQAVKSKSVVTLSVDKTFTEPGIGDHRASSTDTGGVLFLGSHRLLTKARGIVTRKPFYGCMRNVAINNQPATILQNMKTGDVTIGSCPMN